MFDWMIFEPAEYYHQQSKSGNCISSHLLSDFRRNPLLYSKKIKGLISEKPNTAYAIGSAAHKLILEGQDAFNAEYAVADGPVNPSTGKTYGADTQKFKQWAANYDCEVINTADYGLIVKMAYSVKENAEAQLLLSKGVAEGVARCELEGVPCQIRMDWFNPECGIVDLKTTADIEFFESDCRRLNYIYQLAFYRSVLRKVTGKTYPVHILAVEKVEPFTSGVWLLTEEVLDLAEVANTAALKKLRECRESGIFPTGYERKRIIDRL